MSTRGKVWIGMLLFCAMTWGLILRAAFAEDLPPLKVLSWVHIFGCPKPASDVVLWVQDGKTIKVVHIKVDKLDKDAQQKLSATIGDVNGINIVYKCGNEI